MKVETAPEPLASENQAARNLRFTVLHEDFTGTTINLGDPKLTGRQVAEAAGFRPADDVIVLQQLPDGSIEEIRLEELIDLKEKGVERFFVMKGDRTYRLAIDGLRIEWPREAITGETILKLAGKPSHYDVFQDFEDAPDQEVEPEQVIRLDGAGVERFKTKAGPKLVTVYYKETAYQLERRTYTTEELRQVFAVEEGYILELVSKDGEFIELKPGREIRIKKDLRFVSHAPCGQSS